MSASAVDDVRELAVPAAAQAGLVVEDVTITGVGRRRLVKVVVDLPDDELGGVPMDAVSEASRLLSESLDSSSVLGAAPYVLEVTSPGVSRPLTQQRHWKRARTRLVKVHLRPSDAPDAAAKRGRDNTLTARLSGVNDDGIEITGAGGATEHLPWARIERGLVQVEFSDRSEAADSSARPARQAVGTESEED